MKKLIAFLIAKKATLRGDAELPAGYSKHIRLQNPYGMPLLILSGAAFCWPQFGLSLITLLLCIIGRLTFERTVEDNPWPFYLGIAISLLGVLMFIQGEVHELIV